MPQTLRISFSSKLESLPSPLVPPNLVALFQQPKPQLDNEPRRSQRSRREDLREGFFTFLVEGESNTFKEAMPSVDVPFWKEAVTS